MSFRYSLRWLGRVRFCMCGVLYYACRAYRHCDGIFFLGINSTHRTLFSIQNLFLFVFFFSNFFVCLKVFFINNFFFVSNNIFSKILNCTKSISYALREWFKNMLRFCVFFSSFSFSPSVVLMVSEIFMFRKSLCAYLFKGLSGNFRFICCHGAFLYYSLLQIMYLNRHDGIMSH